MTFLNARKMQLALLALAICLLGARLWHIQADFPTYHFYSQDGARFTDEGFYTNAALHHYTLGHAYLPGGWNPGVFMPVWPLLVGALFHFTGISVIAARSLAVICTWLGVLLAYAVTRQYRSRTFASIAALLIAANALGFFFGRLAILEPAFGMFLLLALYLAGKVRPGNYALAALVGVVFVIATLTKTTGPFVLPAVLYPIWANNRKDRPATWKLLAVALGVTFLLLGCAKLVWTHNYQTDMQIILGLAPLWQIEHSLPRLLRFFYRGTWIDPVLFPIALAGFLAAIFRLRFLWRDTLFVTAFLWEAGYAAFIVFHYDGPPRYFVTLIVPTLWLALVFLEWLWRERRTVGMALAACVLASVVWNLTYIAVYLAHPRYTLVDASMEIKRVIEADPQSCKLMIGRGADEISLLSNGFPTMDSDGAMPLADKIDAYHPGWFMQWTFDAPQRTVTVSLRRQMEQRARFSVLGPTGQANLTLYHLLPKR
ncbi:MAG: ArnT family glycosyltransferase [Acidobacteriaceae bacterium]